ncbi:MAG: alpha-glucosidase [Treponema sp.]|nr:alpha-glucosidase [Treponema sp.]
MEKRTWWKEGIVYQVYPRSFFDSNGDGTGDINGIRQKLDYLKDLGVTILWLCPFYKSPDADNGYDISNYEAVQPSFGTMEELSALINEAHQHSLKIIIDLVINHTSSEHSWFLESRKSKTNDYSDFYIWRDGKDGNPPNNWGSVFSGSAWTYSPERGQYYLHLFTPQQPDLNWQNDSVRSELFAMMDRWCRKGIDGFRMDVIGMISKPEDYPDAPVRPGKIYGEWGSLIMNRPQVHIWLKEMNKTVLSKYDLVTVGETSGVTTKDALQYAGFGAHELNMVFQFERPDAETENGSKWTMKKAELSVLKEIFSRWQNDLEGKAWNSLYWENHDQPRSVSRYGDTGKYWKESAKMLAVCLYMQKGTPYIYQGQELGMTNTTFEKPEDLKDIEAVNAYNEMIHEHKISPAVAMQYINRISRDNARTPFQWSDKPQAGFTTGTPWIPVNANYKEINAQKELADPDSVLNFYKKINLLRKKYPVIVYGTYTLLMPDDERLYLYTRQLDNAKLLIVCNFTGEQVHAYIPQEFRDAPVLISNYGSEHSDRSMVRPYEGTVYSINN